MALIHPAARWEPPPEVPEKDTRTHSSSPFLVEQLLHVGDVTLIAHGKIFHHRLRILLVGFADGSLIRLKLNDVDCSVRGS